MNITFLIGNGFDLNLGLHTTFKDFIEVYVQYDEKDSNVIKKFKSIINKNIEKWSDAEIALGECTEKFDGKALTVDDFCECHEDFCIHLSEYLQEEEKYVTLNTPELGKEFSNAILNVTNGFREQQRDQIARYMDSISNPFQYFFISFNYTRTLDECVKLAKQFIGTRVRGNTAYQNTLAPVRHVHGYVDRDMVLGVNDNSQIKNLKLFEDQPPEYLDEIIKIRTNQANEERNDEKTLNILKNSDLVYVYGMAIGATDTIWWSRLCDLMRDNNGIHVIVHAYDAPEEGLIRRRNITFEKMRKHLITSYSSLDDKDRENIEKRIHITGYNIFSGLSNIATPHTEEEKERLLDELVEMAF